MRYFAAAVVVLSLACNPALLFALDWQKLHVQADKNELIPMREKVRNEPVNPEDRYVLGLVCLNLHKDVEAQDIFARMLAVNSQLKEALWGMAEVLRRQHRLAESEEILSGLIKSDSRFSPALITLAYIRYMQRRFDDAVGLAAQVLKQGQEKVDLTNYVRALCIVSGSKGMIAHFGGPFSKAINGTAVYPYLKKAQKLKPDDAGVLFGLGSYYFLAPSLVGGDMKNARLFLERAIQIDPFFTDAYVRLAQWHKIQGDSKKYDEYFAKALALDPFNEIVLDIQNGTCKFICPSK